MSKRSPERHDGRGLASPGAVDAAHDATPVSPVCPRCHEPWKHGGGRGFESSHAYPPLILVGILWGLALAGMMYGTAIVLAVLVDCITFPDWRHPTEGLFDMYNLVCSR